MKTFWNGVIPALTTPFKADGAVDHAFLAKHAGLMMEARCTAIVPLGSLGETATLTCADMSTQVGSPESSFGSVPVTQSMIFASPVLVTFRLG